MAGARSGPRDRRRARRADGRRVGRRYDAEGRNGLPLAPWVHHGCRVSAPISPAPVTNYKAEYIPAYLSNGLIGLRAGRIPLIEGLAIVNGLAAVHPVDMRSRDSPAGRTHWPAISPSMA